MKRNLLCGFWYSVVWIVPVVAKSGSVYSVMSSMLMLVLDISLVRFMYGLSWL